MSTIREVLTESELPPEAQQRRQRARLHRQEYAKHPAELTLPERVKRLEILLGVET